MGKVEVSSIRLTDDGRVTVWMGAVVIEGRCRPDVAAVLAAEAGLTAICQRIGIGCRGMSTWFLPPDETDAGPVGTARHTIR